MTQRILSTPHDLLSPRRALLGAAVLAVALACSKGETRSDTAAGAISDSARTDSARIDSLRADSARRAATPAADTGTRSDSTRRAAAAAARDTTHRAAPTHASTPAKPSTTAKRAASATATTGAAAASSQPAPGAAATTAAAGTTSTAAAADTNPKKDLLAAEPAAYEGWKTFHVYCYRCHGVDAFGGQLAPDLRHSVGPEGSVTHDVFIQTVTNGRLEKGMPSWKELLDRNQMENIWAYLKARSEGRLAPGRPHRATE